MKNTLAAFMVKEIDARIAKRKRPIDKVLAFKISVLRAKVTAGLNLTTPDANFLEQNYLRFTDPTRIKW